MGVGAGSGCHSRLRKTGDLFKTTWRDLRLQFKFGIGPGVPAEPLTLAPVTVFVGPNNSGKSKVLAEIYHFCQTGGKNTQDVILEWLEFLPFDASSASAAITHCQLPLRPAETIQPGNIIVGRRGQRINVSQNELLAYLQNPVANIQAFCQRFASYNTLMLDGASRIGLVREQDAGDLQLEPHSSFQVLFRDNEKRAEIRRIVSEAIGSVFVIDPTHLGKLRARLSSRLPREEAEERGIHDEAVRFHASAQPIEQSSDGVKAFAGIVTELIAGDPRVVLIDEPEAFLHPSLAFKLGWEVSSLASRSQKRLLVSTHSPNFVMGCIQSGAPVNIVRLTYRNSVATSRVLPSEHLLELMRNPLLRSTGMLSGLFYEFVVVTESDADRAFYQEINERLLKHKPEWGIPNCLFLNAQNKQTVQTIITPLRQLGIPAAAIVDVDIVKEGGSVWSGFLSAGCVPAASASALATLRSNIKTAMDSSGKNMKRDGGVEVLSGDSRRSAGDLLDQLAKYGLFVVPGGELESWFKLLGVSGHGPGWLVAMFERLGADPSSEGYVRPSDDDVWAFMAAVKEWLVDPRRAGIPTGTS